MVITNPNANSRTLAPEYTINPYTNNSFIRTYVDDYNYRPPGQVKDVPRETYNYIKTSNSVTTVRQKIYTDNISRIVPAVNFMNWF